MYCAVSAASRKGRYISLRNHKDLPKNKTVPKKKQDFQLNLGSFSQRVQAG